MRKLLLAALALSATLGAATSVEARQGCGVGAHRGPHGRCIVNRVGGYYRGHGYWDGRRYYQHRERYRGHWRYR